MAPPPADGEHLFRVVDALDAVAQETSKTVPQIALNWLLQRPTVSSIIIGARNERQLRDNLGAVDWRQTAEQMAKLDTASSVTPIYPYWHQRSGFSERNPPPPERASPMCRNPNHSARSRRSFGQPRNKATEPPRTRCDVVRFRATGSSKGHALCGHRTWCGFWRFPTRSTCIKWLAQLWPRQRLREKTMKLTISAAAAFALLLATAVQPKMPLAMQSGLRARRMPKSHPFTGTRCPEFPARA
jgi:hypothetical protein